MSEARSEMRFAEFARHIGVRPSYVTQLKREGRLVLSDDGKAVKAAESLARIQETRDPSKAAVAARHASARGRSEVDVSAVDPSADHEDIGPVTDTRYDYQAARAKREYLAAETAELEFRKQAGELIEVSALQSVLADAAATICASLDRIEHDLVPALKGLSEEEIRLQVREYIDQIRADLAESFAKMGRGEL